MIFNGYNHAMDRKLYFSATGVDMYSTPNNNEELEIGQFYSNKSENIKSSDYHQAKNTPGLHTGMIGKTIAEGSHVGGDFIRTFTSAIHEGASSVELSTSQEGQGFGSESYGEDKRRALREMRIANEVKINSVHAPSGIANISGKDQQGNFSEEQRAYAINEIKKAIRFAADVATGGSVVVHTGEFHRNISDVNKYDSSGNYKFRINGGFMDEEHSKELESFAMVDKTTGRVQNIEKSHVFTLTRWDDSKSLSEPQTANFTYSDVEHLQAKAKNGDAQSWNKLKTWFGTTVDKPEDLLNLSPGSILIRQHYAGSLAQAKGMLGEYSAHLEQIKEQELTILRQKKLYLAEKDHLPDYQKKGQIRLPDGTIKTVSKEEEFDHNLKQIRNRLLSYKNHVESYVRQVKQTEQQIENTIDIETYGKEKSTRSLAELGLTALERSKFKKKMYNSGDESYSPDDIYIAPENIFPEWGYGSHPEELIELVQESRKKMAKLLTSKYIEVDGIKKENPHYKPDITYDQAQELAKKHIKSTFDTQHLLMWRKHFVAKPGETEEETDKRFDDWYMDQVKKLSESDIIGNIHIVDGMGFGHTHVAVGEGKGKVVDAVSYLVKKGYSGTMNSEAYEDASKQLVGTWKAFGMFLTDSDRLSGRNVYNQRWTDIHSSYFGRTQGPTYMFGEYAPNPEETRMWSGVPDF